MNVMLVGLGNDDDEWVSALLSKFLINRCAVVFENQRVANTSVIGLKYATDVFYHDKSILADYDIYPEYSDAPPVDEVILDKLSPYHSQVMWMMERNVSREYNHRWNDYTRHIRFWNHVLRRLDIDVVIFPNAPHEVYNYIIYLLCKINGVKCVMLMPMSYYNTAYFIEDIYNHLPNFCDEYRQLKNSYENCYNDEIKLSPLLQEMYDFYVGNGDRMPWYMKPHLESGNYFVNKMIERGFCESLIKFILSFKRNNGVNKLARLIRSMYTRSCFAVKVLSSFFSWSPKSCSKVVEYFYSANIFREHDVIFKIYNSNISKVDYKKKYIYIPLHMQPELTSSPLGGVFVDQLLIIKMLSFFVPSDWLIYVKENPKQAWCNHVARCSSYRTVSFYEEILKLSNVRLVSLEEDTFELIKHAKAVASITGTACLEAITHGVPSLVFGSTYLEYAPNVYKIRTNDDCLKAINQVKDFTIPHDYYNSLKLYFKCLEKYIKNTTVQFEDLNNVEDVELAKRNLVEGYYEAISDIA